MIAAVPIKPSARSATPLNWGLSAVMNSCLTLPGIHRSPNFPPKNSLPPSDRTDTTLEETPSGRVSARNYSNNSVASHLWPMKYTNVYREKLSHNGRVYVDYLMPLRRSVAMEHLLLSRSSPSRKIACCSAVFRSGTS